MRAARQRLPGVLLLLLLAPAAPARAQDDNPDVEIAQRHFRAGVEHYDAKRYEPALHEFEAARRAKPLAAFDYNIARCLDRLERWPEAIVAYERYVSSQPEPPDAASTRVRIRELRERIAEQPAPPAPAPPPAAPPSPPVVAPSPPLVPAAAVTPPPRDRRMLIAASVVGAAALASIAAGAGLYVDVSHQLSDCKGMGGCADSTVDGLHAPGYASYALFAVGGALAAADVALWVLYGTRGRGEHRAAFVVPTVGGLLAGGTF